MLGYPLNTNASINEIVSFLRKVRDFPDGENAEDRIQMQADASLVFNWILPLLEEGMSTHEVFVHADARKDEALFESNSILCLHEWRTLANLACEIADNANVFRSPFFYEEYEEDGFPLDDTDFDNCVDESEAELYMLAAMQHGVIAANEAKGYFTETPSSCGHHCYLGCDVCGG
jgi:hypothetical protein